MSITVLPRKARALVLDLTVPGEPVPWQRARRGKSGRSFTDPKQAAQQDLIRLLALGVCQQPTDAPVIVEMDFFVGNHRRADLSNFLKLVEDALNGVAFDDDSQIIEAHVHKHVDKTFPRTEVLVWKVVQE